MFDADSRYADIPTGTYEAPDGRQLRYVRRRILPDGADLTVIGAETVGPGDRLDHIAYRALGDPTLFWMIADAMNAADPTALTRLEGSRLAVTLPQPPTGSPRE